MCNGTKKLKIFPWPNPSWIWTTFFSSYFMILYLDQGQNFHNIWSTSNIIYPFLELAQYNFKILLLPFLAAKNELWIYLNVSFTLKKLKESKIFSSSIWQHDEPDMQFQSLQTSSKLSPARNQDGLLMSTTKCCYIFTIWLHKGTTPHNGKINIPCHFFL